MEIKKIVDYVNRGYIASDYLREPEIYYYMDMVIDDINDRLQATFPTFTEWHEFVDKWNKYVEANKATPVPAFPIFLRDASKYDAFPDKYLRSVVALGVAVKYYARDEEGEQVALDYQNKYLDALFKMTRDYHSQVPWYFQDNEGGFIDFSHNREEGPRDLHPRGVVMHGINTRIL